MLVIVADDLDRLIAKGEITERYYNPDNFFDEVEIIAVTDGPPPDLEHLKVTVGSADLTCSCIKRPPLVSTLGWNQRLLRQWLSESVSRIETRPDLIRIHGLHLNGLLAIEARQRFKAPLVASIHEVGDWYKNLEIRACRNPLKKILLFLYSLRTRQFARIILENCDEIICVYRSICEYVSRLSPKTPRLIYNAVAPGLPSKTSYELHSPVRLLNVGRQTPGVKEPSTIIKALEGLPVELEVIGDGPMHSRLERIAAESGVKDKVRFISFQPNGQIVRKMKDYDIFVYRYNNWEISKSVIEALLCGLPVVLNRKEDYPVAEFEGADHLLLVSDTPEYYREAIRKLIDNAGLREELGRKARAFALKNYGPEKIEKQVADLYRSLLER